MAIPVDKFVAVFVLAANIVAAWWFPGDHAFFALIAALVSLPGLTLIWFRESLSFASFARGVAHSSPPLLVGFFGWAGLLFFPLWFVYRASLG